MPSAPPPPASTPTALTQLEQLHARYAGSGHANMTQHEWAEHQHRDSIASYLAHARLLDYFAVAEGVSTGNVRHNLQQRFVQMCGPPPRRCRVEDMRP